MLSRFFRGRLNKALVVVSRGVCRRAFDMEDIYLFQIFLDKKVIPVLRGEPQHQGS